MAKIAGDVDVLGISNLLQVLSMSKCEGYLTLSQDSQKKVIHFSSDGIRLVSGARRTNPLGEILIRTGRITGEQLDEVLAEKRQTGEQLGAIVARRGILDEEVIQSALREQVAEEIYDLFTWMDAKFEFVMSGSAGVPKDDGPLAHVVLDLNVMSIMLEAARRVDELARIQAVIPDVRLVAEKQELPVALDDPGLDRNALEEILALVDGARSVGHIIEESLYPKFTVLRTLYGLAQRGVIKIRDKGDGDEGPITVVRPRMMLIDDKPLPPGRTVLLLSELPTFRGALGHCLRTAGFNVVEGAGVPDASRILPSQYVDVIIFDVSIETEDGLAACNTLREGTKTPFIVLAGNSSRRAITNAIQSGARYVLLKPVKEELLLDRLSRALSDSVAAS